MTRLRIGIVGCGEATQILHLPSLRQLDELFEVTAVCDASADVAARVAHDWAVPVALRDPAELVARPDVDAVLIASPDDTHGPIARAALAAGKHVLVEKPMCVTLAQADALIEAQGRSGRVVQVGYMRLHAPAFAAAKELVGSLGEVRLARVHQMLGANALIIDPTSRVARPAPSGLPPSGLEPLMREAIGDVGAAELAAFRLLLGLSSHDLSVMRELLGVPERVLYATLRHGSYMTAAFDYGSFVCTFETGTDDIARFDCHIEVYGAERVVRLEYDTPYVRNLPTRIVVTEANGTGGVRHTTEQPSWGDAFVAEWRAFHRCVSEGVRPRTTPRDFRHDLELFIAIARAFTTPA